jgi:hypothetical protein
MDILKSLTLEQVQAIGLALLIGMTGLVSVAEVVVRFTPTKKDDGVVKRIGVRIDALLDLAGVPNKIKPPEPSEKKKTSE